jgi:RNA polymerase sigma factor (sigma-70 family)
MPLALASSPLDALAREAHRHHLLTAAEEIELSRRVQRGMQPDSTPKEQRIGKRARERMINANLLLVIKNALGYRKRIAGTMLDVEDLCQAGIIGLDRAVDKFDSEKGYKFSTYATWWIRQALTKEVTANCGTIKVSPDVQTIARRWRYRKEGVTLDAFCEEFGYKREKVEATLVQYQRAQCVSLDKVCNDGDGVSLVELLADEEQPDLDTLHYTMAIEQLEADPATCDAIAALSSAETARHREMASILGVPMKQVPKRLEDLRAVVREHLINPCQTGSTETEPMTATAPTSNGHAHLERLIEEVQSEVKPEPKAEVKPKRVRRTKEQLAAANAEKAAKQPALITIVLDGHDVTGTPQNLASLLSALPARAAA